MPPSPAHPRPAALAAKEFVLAVLASYRIVSTIGRSERLTTSPNRLAGAFEAAFMELERIGSDEVRADFDVHAGPSGSAVIASTLEALMVDGHLGYQKGIRPVAYILKFTEPQARALQKKLPGSTKLWDRVARVFDDTLRSAFTS